MQLDISNEVVREAWQAEALQHFRATRQTPIAALLVAPVAPLEARGRHQMSLRKRRSFTLDGYGSKAVSGTACLSDTNGTIG